MAVSPGRLGIAAKAVILIVGLGVLSALANAFALQAAQSLDHVNSIMAQRVAPARLALAEAKAALGNLGLAVFKTMAASERDVVRQAGGEIANQSAAARQWLAAVRDYFPSRADDIALINDKLARAEAIAGEIRAAALAGETRRIGATTLDLRFDAALDDTLGQMNRLTNILGGEALEALAQAESDQAFTLRLIVIVLAAGTLVTVLLALALTELSVARPLRRLTAQTLRIREGGALEADAADPALRRVDEIGTLARAFHLMIGELKAAQETLATQYARIDAAINNLPQGLCMFDAEQRLIICNRRYAELYALDAAHTRPGTPLRAILEARSANGRYQQVAVDYVETRLAAVAMRRPIYTVDELTGGQFIAISHQPMLDGGSVAIHEDITERRAVEAKIAHMAHHDALTDLPNRARFRDAMVDALKVLDHGRQVATLCLDLDQFKTVNDTLGHPVGDALLQAVAGRLRACAETAEAERMEIARLGGDEFAIVQVGGAQPLAATTLAEEIIAALAAPFEVQGHQVVIGVSIGIAVAPGDGRDPDQLMRNADMALYRAKADGRGSYHFFEPGMDARMQERRALELDLRKAIERDELELYYQPLIRLDTDAISGFEALLRWRHPRRGMVPPSKFIPLAEEIGVIGAIGAWVLNRACQDAATWPPHIKVAVNLSPVQFKNSTLGLQVIAALGASGLSGERLELEITETVLLQDTDATLSMLNELRALGVRISMDDFGTGYSSLGYLRKFPFDKIKIDRSFIQDLADKPDSIAIVRAVASIGSALGMATTAEGVETEEELAQLRHEGCTEVQGYLFSEPKPAREIAQLIAQCGAPAVVNG
jgi:diguanylate cyclase (GGDEF)-like protein